jgi:hypothetical protein
MSSLSFLDFVSQLPRGDRLPPKRFPLPDWILQPRSPNLCFVEPDLIPEIAVESGKTSVVILSAPGAVGKSTVAKELAFLCKATFWDLSKVQVGSRTFIGAIYDIYQENGLGIEKDLKEGSGLVVLDALDEAQVRAGSSNFEAFLNDLIGLLKEPHIKPAIVLLARSDTATWIELFFEESGVPYAHYKIGNFNESQAIDFINKRLDAVGAKQHRQQRGPFIDVRTRLFNLIYRLLGVSRERAWDDVRVGTFLGYAPVLEALSDYLNHPNYQSLINELENEAGATHDPWRFLEEVVHRLLLRERDKQQDALRTSLGSSAKEASPAVWTNLYSEHEQCRRALEYSLKLHPGPMEVELPPRLAADYEAKIRLEILPLHPFLAGSQRFANVVFKEYLYAWGLTNGYRELTEALHKAMCNRLEPFLPTHLFSRFILRPDEATLPVLEGRDLGVLYDSLLMRAEASDDVSLTIFQSGESVQLSASLGPNAETEVECELMTARDGILIWRQLKRADIDVSVPVELGLEGQRFLLGPGVSLSCSQLTVGCDDIDIDISEPVHLRADTYGQTSQNLRIKVWNGPPSSLAVSWPSIAHPWGPYRGLETAVMLQLKDDLWSDELGKILQMFRRQRTRRADTVFSKRRSPEQLTIRNELVDLAQQMGVLRKVGRGRVEFFIFDNEYGSLMTLLEGPPRLTERALGFVKAYLGNDKAQRLLQK